MEVGCGGAGFAEGPAAGNLGALGGVGGAIELRSKLQQLDLEMRKPGQGGGWEEVEGAWVKLPPGRAWGCVHFLGGAVLGAFPHIVYVPTHPHRRASGSTRWLSERPAWCCAAVAASPTRPPPPFSHAKRIFLPLTDRVRVAFCEKQRASHLP